ncbi:MAG TPA: DUF922 domain-containing protein [Allosphingosinicella sp.]|nr:DUF922 domain-containing protein [Allosphingosinicella sp.]
MVNPAKSSWSAGAGFRKETLEGKCKISSAKVTFQGEALMPRLVNPAAVPAEVLVKWQAFVTELEARQAANLKFAYDRIGEVEKAIKASTCEGAPAAANAALETLKKQQAEYLAQNPPGVSFN